MTNLLPICPNVHSPMETYRHLPLNIVKDRYCGAYSQCRYRAWHVEPPEDIDGSDVDCADFWYRFDGICGKGNTPEEAGLDLLAKLRTKRIEF